jgi:hypothetical protein
MGNLAPGTALQKQWHKDHTRVEHRVGALDRFKDSEEKRDSVCRA